jgi:cell division protein ZapA
VNDMFAHVTIRILEKDYQVSCPAEEKAELMAAAELLNKNMREIRDSGKVVGLDRVAVMAALNMANELLTRTEKEQELKEIVNLRVKAMSSQLDSALGSSAKQLSF